MNPSSRVHFVWVVWGYWYSWGYNRYVMDDYGNLRFLDISRTSYSLSLDTSAT